ncbi:MAG: SpoIIE family protein phosphatase [Bacteroidota bacterium]
MFKNKRLAYKLNVSILSAVFVIFAMILLYNYYVSRKLILKNVQENTKNLTSSAINKSEGFFKVIEKIVLNAGYTIQDTEKSAEEVELMLSGIVKNNDEIYGSCLAFSPYKFSPRVKYFAPYYFEKGDSLLYKDLANSGYYYPDWAWYRNAIDKGKPVWSEPYYDEGGGNVLMTTYSVPLYQKCRQTDSICGVITADVSLKWLQKIVSQIKIFETGYAFLISQKGTFITYPDTSFVMHENIFSLAEKTNDPDLKKIGDEMVAGHEDFAPFNSRFHEGKCWIYYTHLTNNDWSLGFVFPEDELYADLHKLNQMLILMAVAGLAMLLLIIISISNRVTRPLRRLALIAEGFGKGNFDITIPPSTSNDEVGSLNKSFGHMQAELKQYIENLKRTTSAKEKIESELKIARDIQMGMIPRNFPAFSDRNEFDIYGFIEPAREVGGDLYDFFFIDDHHLCFVIGDVSGKGMPAALFMAITRTILRAEAQMAEVNASKVIELVNDYLCRDNESNLFVTLIFGILDTRTGVIEFANAGHNYPFIVKRDGSVSELKNTHCIPLGISNIPCKKAGTVYNLEAGDTIFLYTDGINEAFDSNDQQYTSTRISDMLVNKAHLTPFELVGQLIKDVQAFSSGTEQSDDISVLAIKYIGNKDLNESGNDCRIVIQNKADNLPAAAEKIRSFCHDNKVSDETCFALNLIVEELVFNTISYGYNDDQSHDITISFSIEADGIQLEITDDAIAFNPLDAEAPDINAAISERKIGGLGIHLVKNLSDSFSYQRAGSNNIIQIHIPNHG